MFRKNIALMFLSLATVASLHASDPFMNDPFGDDIFGEMMQMQKEMDSMFERMHQRMQQRSQALISPIGTYKIASQSQFTEKGDHYLFKTDIPESKENSVHISVDNHTLNIKAKVIKKEESKQNGMVSYQRYMSMYQRSLPLPIDADESSMKSAYEEGYLTISFKKKSPPKPTQVTAQAKKDNNQSK